MFGRCNTTTASAAKAAKTITGHGSRSTTAATGSEIAAEIDATDAYRHTAKTTIQTTSAMPPTSGATPRKAPPEVATTFPPRANLRNSGRQ
jgi:hypothetical protein